MLVGGFDLLKAKEVEAMTAIGSVNEMLEYWLARSDIEQIRSGGWPRRREEKVSPALNSVSGARKEFH